jgi:hypothetical protein
MCWQHHLFYAKVSRQSSRKGAVLRKFIIISVAIVVGVSAAFVLIVTLLNPVSSDTSAKTEQTESAQTNQAPMQTNQAPAQTNVPPTVVAEGKTPKDHVIEYYDAYKEGRLEDAFNLAPTETKAAQPHDDFIANRKGMPISDYTIKSESEEGNRVTIDVQYDLGQNGAWVCSWTFEKEDGKWEALSSHSAMAGMN